MPIVDQFAVVVVNFGSHALVEKNLSHIDFDAIGARAVIVDNFSSLEERQAIRALCELQGWELVELANVGFGTAVNRGADRAFALGSDMIVIANPDLAATNDVLVALAAQTRADPITLVCPRIVSPGAVHWFSGGRLDLATGRTSTSPVADISNVELWLTGACLGAHRSFWDRVGGFDDDYFLYWEDIDLSWRWRHSGGQLRVQLDLVVEHSVGGTQQQTGKSDQYFYYNCRNRLIFAKKHLPRKDQLRWILGSASYARRVLLRGGRRSLIRRPLPPVWAATLGTVRGIAYRPT